MSTNAELYEGDFFAWTQTTAALIRAGKWYDIAPEALAEEVESLGARDHRELRRRLQRLVTHLLKWQYQPSRRQTGHSARSTIRTQRQEITDLLEQSPSLQRTSAGPRRRGRSPGGKAAAAEKHPCDRRRTGSW